jgi:Fur family ferric uptake transcriptional regulator
VRAASVSARLHEAGFKRSAIRDAVLQAFFRGPGHVSIEELTRRTREIAPKAAYSTVYRTLRLLVERGFADVHDFGGAHTLYEPARADHHDHLVCTSCGKVQEFEDAEIERLQARAARKYGFAMRSHRLELYGTCARCRAATPHPHP